MKYTIKKGDTLSAIAKANNTSVSELAKLNGISNPNLIYAGATLEIPDAAPKTEAPAVSSSGAAKASSYSAPYGTSSADPAAPSYKESAAVSAARESLEKWESEAPDDYQSPYQKSIDQTLAAILGREDFSYDPAADPVYRYYRDRYLSDGEKAMRDTVGTASALTGGYANSYAALAGQSAYNDHVTKLSEIIPALAAAAFERYGEKWQGVREDLEALLGLDDTEYKRYRDALEDYYGEGDYLYKKYSDYADDDYGKYLDALKQWNSDRDYDRKVYEDERDAAYKAQRDALEDDRWEREFALALQKASSGGSSGGKGSSSSSGSKDSSAKINVESGGYYPSSELSDDGSSAFEAMLNTVGDKVGTSSGGFSYFNCGTKARKIIDQYMTSDIYDSRGNLKATVIDYLKLQKKKGYISADEYNYIRERFEKGYK